MRPSAQVVPDGPPSTPHSTVQVAVAAHVTAHPAAQVTSQLAVSMQKTLLPSPRFSLQSEVPEHAAPEPAPAFSWHLDEEMQLMRLPSPPMPLHSEVSAQLMVVAAVDEALHLAAVSQERLHAAAPQLAVQSVPAEQVHDARAQLHAVPLHVGAAVEVEPPPQEMTAPPTAHTAANRIAAREIIAPDIRARDRNMPVPCTTSTDMSWLMFAARGADRRARRTVE
jgi:hypothetical protein